MDAAGLPATAAAHAAPTTDKKAGLAERRSKNNNVIRRGAQPFKPAHIQLLLFFAWVMSMASFPPPPPAATPPLEKKSFCFYFLFYFYFIFCALA